MAKAVQFRGTPALMKAFSNVKIAAWAIFWDKQLLHKYAGESFEDSEAMLQELIRGMEKSNSTTTYTLCLYEDVKDRKKIKASTEPDFSYNFTLFDQEEYPAPGSVRRSEGYAMILDKVDQLDAKLALLKKEEGEEDEEEEEMGSVSAGWLGAINKVLDNPAVQQRIGDKFCEFIENLGKPAPIPIPQKQIASMGNVNNDAPVKEITQEQIDKINQAIQVLAGVDPSLGDNLLKLAGIAEKNPKKYRNLVTMLNTFV